MEQCAVADDIGLLDERDAAITHCLIERFNGREAAVGERLVNYGARGGAFQPTPLQSEEQFPPRLRTLTHTVGEADKFLPALGCGA